MQYSSTDLRAQPSAAALPFPHLKPSVKKLSPHLVFRPQIFKLKFKSQQKKFKNLLKRNPSIKIFDNIESQVADLIKLRHPQESYRSANLHRLALNALGEHPQEYGVWVYYPWSGRMVHTLDKKDFAQARTIRNYYKITPEEQKTLSRKKVGVIGLSVGQSVAITMAMERSFGEIRLADFDRLELTNLNRIRTGIHNIGLLKVISVAREIAEIDPFLKVTCFTHGLQEGNLERFLLNHGKLDALIDECDGLDMKVLCRQKAKLLHIPVLMEASDRGMIDIERFDLEPRRPILHGLLKGMDIRKLKTLKTNAEKLPYLNRIVNFDHVSPRLKASLLEIKKTITTWPQLAADVTLGGGITAEAYRHIMLGQFHESGRYYVDTEKIFSDR